MARFASRRRAAEAGSGRYAVRAAIDWCLGRGRSERPSTATPTAGGILRAAIFHYGRRVLNGNRTTRAIADVLADMPTARVLDFGCGCGGLCVAVRGDYVGIDLDPNYVAFARWRWRHPRRRFLLTRLEDLAADERFDAAIMASALHHLSDQLAHAILARLAEMVSRRVVVLDHDPEAANRWQRVLIDLDRGQDIRTIGEQRALLSRYFVVEGERRIATTTGSAVHSLFVCTPRR
jgi:SAM-dependent methyltransferase